MSILKFFNGKNRSVTALKKSVNYIFNEAKTSEHLKGGSGISIDTAIRDMVTIQQIYGKTEGRSCIHYVISFDKGVSAELAYTVAEKCASYYAEEYQFCFAVHTDRPNKHAHVVMNAVNAKTGYKFSQSKAEMFRFREFINRVLEEYGLNPIGRQTERADVVIEKYFADEDEWNDEDFSDWVSEFEDDECSTKLFKVDEEEVEQIQHTESWSKLESDIINFFEGNSCDDSVFQDIAFSEAKQMYQAWKDGHSYEENDDCSW